MLLSSTHTHAGPAGYSHYAAYNLSSYGFNAATFGAMSWFGTHGTSLTNGNRLISGDNKGYAAYLWEHSAPAPGFVAAFMQASSADISPNLNLRPGSGPTENPVENTRIIGQRQAEAAVNIHSGSTSTLTGGVGYRHTFADMSAVTVSPAYTGDGQPHTTCPAAIGVSMLAGSTEDGPGIPLLPEGVRNPFVDALGGLGLPVPGSLAACQAPKPVAVPVGLMQPVPWTPEVLPLQLLWIGDLYIAGVPAEVTIVSGYRLRRTIAASLGVPAGNVIIAGFANAYSQYLATPEEYEAQQYEGASTLFSKWTLPAYQQEFARLGSAMRAGQAVPAGPAPRDLRNNQLSFQTGVVFDDVPLGRWFGDVETQPRAQYAAGQTARAVFWTGHPKNNLRRGGTFLEVQRLTGGTWTRVAGDKDWSTVYRWAHSGIAYSTATVEWSIPAGTPAGTYRIVHHGDWKSGWAGKVSPLTGTSRTFTVT